LNGYYIRILNYLNYFIIFSYFMSGKRTFLPLSKFGMICGGFFLQTKQIGCFQQCSPRMQTTHMRANVPAACENHPAYLALAWHPRPAVRILMRACSIFRIIHVGQAFFHGQRFSAATSERC
jgi:hypothetical protein